VYFPDIPGCVSCGNNFDHALYMAKEALALHIFGMEKDGEKAPPRTDRVSKTDVGDMVVPVTIYPDIVKDEINNRRVKTTITIPYWIKSAAEAEGVNYSRLLENALKETLGAVSCFSPVSAQKQKEPVRD
jgi:predicted RNase H-like HicB family nuclease